MQYGNGEHCQIIERWHKGIGDAALIIKKHQQATPIGLPGPSHAKNEGIKTSILFMHIGMSRQEMTGPVTSCLNIGLANSVITGQPLGKIDQGG